MEQGGSRTAHQKNLPGLAISAGMSRPMRPTALRRSAKYCRHRHSANCGASPTPVRSEEHTSELQSLMRISYAVFCLKKKNHNYKNSIDIPTRKNNNTIH